MSNERVNSEQIWQKWQELRSLTPKEWRGSMISMENRLHRLLNSVAETAPDPEPNHKEKTK